MRFFRLELAIGWFLRADHRIANLIGDKKHMRHKDKHGRCVSAHMQGELTPTEAKILILVGQGHKSKEAAEKLVVSKRTVDFHLFNAYDFLGVGNRVEAVEEAIRRGLINPEEILPVGYEPNPSCKLTPTELKVAKLRLLHPAKVVAEKLVVSKRTVDFHLANIYDKLQIHNVMQLSAIVRMIRRRLDVSTRIGAQIINLYEEAA